MTSHPPRRPAARPATTESRFDVVLADERPCHRCGGALYLTATIPHPGWANARGERVTGRRVLGLCAACDAHDPASQALLAYFAIHNRVTPATAGIFAGLVADRVHSPGPTAVDPERLDSEITAWSDDPDNPDSYRSPDRTTDRHPSSPPT